MGVLLGFITTAVLLLVQLGGPLAQEQEEPPADRSALGRPERPEPFTLQVEVDAWYVVPSGWIYITKGGRDGSATHITLGREFDVDEGIVPAAEAELRVSDAYSIGARFARVHETGTTTASDTFVYHAETYDAGRLVRTELDLTFVELDLRYTWPLTEAISLTGRWGAEYWHFYSRLTTVDDLAPIDERRFFGAVMPLVGLDLEARAGDAVSARLSLGAGFLGSGRRLLEAELAVRIRVFGGASFTAGYLIHEQRFRQSTNRADLLYQGPTLGIDWRF